MLENQIGEIQIGLNEQLGVCVLLNTKQQKWSLRKTKNGFLSKNFFW